MKTPTPTPPVQSRLREHIAVMEAFADGKPIEWRNDPVLNPSPGNIWERMRPDDAFNFQRNEYRVAPLPAEPVAGESLEAAICILRYRVGNPSAWDHYDDNASEDIRRLLDLLESWTPPRPGEGEQRAFEDWLERVSPSGDAESVRRQWEASSDFKDSQPPASAAREWVPEGLPPLEGEFADFDYFGPGPLKHWAAFGSQHGDVIACTGGRWNNNEGSGYRGSFPARHYAIRRGTEPHRRNFTP